jgi:hypothetical protein
MAITHNSVRSTRDKEAQDVKLYKRPFGISPWSKGEESRSGSVWIRMKPKKILDQYSKGADAPISTVDTKVTFEFLAPLSLNENIVHHWEAYESVASRLAQKARSLVKLTREVKAGSSAIGSFIGAKMRELEQEYLQPNAKDKSTSSPKRAKQSITTEGLIDKAVAAVPGHSILNKKVDTPMYYTNSDRRQLILEFVLFNEMRNNDEHPEKQLIEPIQAMMKYSSPDLINEGGITIDFPYMWEVSSYPINFINYPTCALVAVQPTWNSPYVKGYPISCNLQLTFQDLSPLYAGTIQYGTIINVKTDNVKNVKIRDSQAYKKMNKVKPSVKRIQANQGYISQS